MKAHTLVLCLSLSVLACDDDPMAPTGPTAAFTITPPAGWTDTEFLFDASTSSDPGDATQSRVNGWEPELSTSFAVRVHSSGMDADDLVQRYRIGSDDPAAHAPVATVEGLFVLTPGALPAQELRAPHSLLSSPQTVVQALTLAYRRREPDLFASLLAQEAERNAEYLFLLSEPTELGETQWGYQEEARIHQRMFHPESTPPGDPPVPADLWLQEVTITLTPLENFTERVDLYSENGGLDGKLDPAIWRVKDALYTTYVLFDFTGTDYKVEGRANFVVVEDLTKNIGVASKFLIWIWEDIYGPVLRQAGTTAVSEATWSNVKDLFR